MNSTPDQIQAMTELIAKLLGWTELNIDEDVDLLVGLEPKGDSVFRVPPNWPGDRNASKDLSVEDMEKFTYFIEAVSIWGPIPEGGRDPRLSAEKECLAWLFYKGYRWVECGCENVDVCNNEYHEIPCLEDHHCPNIICEGGKFVKEVTDG